MHLLNIGAVCSFGGLETTISFFVLYLNMNKLGSSFTKAEQSPGGPGRPFGPVKPSTPFSPRRP